VFREDAGITAFERILDLHVQCPDVVPERARCGRQSLERNLADDAVTCVAQANTGRLASETSRAVPTVIQSWKVRLLIASPPPEVDDGPSEPH
jgi:hypothetical protein